MPENNKSTVKKKVLPVLVLVTTFYYSFLVMLGLILGYFGAKIYCKALGIDENSDRRIFVECGKWKIHFHHWIMGAIVLLIVWFVDYFYLPSFFVGVIGGVIAHDIYDFNDWHQIIVKNDAVATAENQ